MTGHLLSQGLTGTCRQAAEREEEREREGGRERERERERGSLEWHCGTELVRVRGKPESR